MISPAIIEKIYILKNNPNISEVDRKLLLKLEKLLYDENYSNEYNYIISSIIDENLKKFSILKLTALLNTLSDKVTICYNLNLENKLVNLIPAIEKLNNEQSLRKLKENIYINFDLLKETLKNTLKENFIFVLIFIGIGIIFPDLIIFLFLRSCFHREKMVD